ncbi:MAG: 26 kDa periplasmic immunogenic protein precursor [Parcubacteria group bacterium ADurb.Bin316]|nr:MAG: 26 kDa periplasmic immunogenic protein precursor [Parcubacteria group bacterium ADurb.Bin316]
MEISKVAKPEDALNQLNEKMKQVIAAIEKSGIPKENIQTQNYTLNPQYDIVDGISKINGYNANQSISVKINEINKNANKVAEIIAAAGKAGTNKINGVSFEASNLNDLKQEARIKAILDARTKAKNIGNALGVKLGKIVGWWENYIYPESTIDQYYGKGGMGGGGAMTEPSIPTGSRELVVEVNVNYKIK